MQNVIMPEYIKRGKRFALTRALEGICELIAIEAHYAESDRENKNYYLEEYQIGTGKFKIHKIDKSKPKPKGEVILYSQEEAELLSKIRELIELFRENSK